MGIKRSRAALAGGTMASVLGAAIGVALVLGAILGMVAFPAAPRPTGSPQPVVVLPADAAGRAEGAAARPRRVEIAAATRPVARRQPRAGRAARDITPRRTITRRGPEPAPPASAPARRVAATPSTPVAAAAPWPTPVPSAAVAVPPVSPAADAVQGAVDTATGVVTEAGGALPPLPKPPAHAG